MGKPKPRTYYVHEILTVTNVYEVLASNRTEAVEKAKEVEGGAFDMTDAQPTGEWWAEPRPKLRKGGE